MRRFAPPIAWHVHTGSSLARVPKRVACSINCLDELTFDGDNAASPAPPRTTSVSVLLFVTRCHNGRMASAIPQRIEPEGSSWLTHWRCGSASDKISLVGSLATAVWLTVRWHQGIEPAFSPFPWLRVTGFWVLVIAQLWRWPMSEKIAPVLTELGLRRTRSHKAYVAASDSLQPETDVRSRRGMG